MGCGSKYVYKKIEKHIWTLDRQKNKTEMCFSLNGFAMVFKRLSCNNNMMLMELTKDLHTKGW